MAAVTKLITNTDKYFQYENSSTPTKESDFQAYLKNMHTVVENLVDYLWQQTTVYKLNTLVRSPNMPAGVYAKCVKAGTSGANEPVWSTSVSQITDGSCKWILIAMIETFTANGDVSGTGSVDNVGNVTVSLSLPNKTTAGTIGETTTVNGREFYTPYITVDSKGRIVGYGKRKVTITNFLADRLTVSGTKQVALSPFVSGFNKEQSITTFTTNTGIPSGSYSIATLLQKLVNMSHSHTSKKIAGANCDCNCNCDCSDDTGS